MPKLNEGTLMMDGSSDGVLYQDSVKIWPKPAFIRGIQDTPHQAGISAANWSVTVNLGPSFKGREIWIAKISLDSDEHTVRIGGNEPELMLVNGDASSSIGFWRYRDDGALGETATLEIDYKGVQAHVGAVIFTSDSTKETIDSHISRSGSSKAPEADIDSSDQGWVFAVSVTQNGNDGTLPYDMGVSFDYGTGEWVAAGYASPANGSLYPVVNHSGASGRINTIAGISRK